MSCEHHLHVFTCTRCGAMFAVDSLEEKRAGIEWQQFLLVNPCKVCGKGQLEYRGYVKVWR